MCRQQRPPRRRVAVLASFPPLLLSAALWHSTVSLPHHDCASRSAPARATRLRRSWRPAVDLNIEGEEAGKFARAGLPVRGRVRVRGGAVGRGWVGSYLECCFGVPMLHPQIG